MLTAPASNRQVTSFSLSPLVQPVQRVEEAFARHLEHMVDALRDQRRSQDMPTQTRFHWKPSARGRTGSAAAAGRGSPAMFCLRILSGTRPAVAVPGRSGRRIRQPARHPGEHDVEAVAGAGVEILFHLVGDGLHAADHRQAAVRAEDLRQLPHRQVVPLRPVDTR